MVVESIDAILVAPVALAVAQQLLQLGKRRPEVGIELLDVLPIVDIVARR